MQSKFDIGYSATFEAIEGDRLGEFLPGVMAAQDGHLKGGALAALFTVHDALRDKGITFDTPDAQRNHFLHLAPSSIKAEVLQAISNADHHGAAWRIGALVAVVSRCKSMLKFSYPKAAPLPAPEPQLVRVVGMPDRITQTAVTRDDQGEIVATTQLQKDYA